MFPSTVVSPAVMSEMAALKRQIHGCSAHRGGDVMVKVMDAHYMHA